MFIRDAGGARDGDALHQLAFDILQQIRILHADVAPAEPRLDVRVGGLAAVVHQDGWGLMAGGHGGEVGVGAKSPHVVDKVRAGVEGGLRHGGFVGVDGDEHVGLAAQRLDDRHNARQLLVRADLLRAGAGRIRRPRPGCPTPAARKRRACPSARGRPS